jgi:tRNA U34 2-thiouridine synthase MnmA/TrmU
MSFTVTHSLGKLPTFPELQELARQHDVHINGNEQAGDFCHPNSEQPKVKGNYNFEPNGDIRGDFTSHVIGKLNGIFVFTTGKAEITITEKPFLFPEVVLKTKILEALKDFCAKFSPAA